MWTGFQNGQQDNNINNNNTGKKGCETQQQQQPRNIGRGPSKPKLVCHFK